VISPNNLIRPAKKYNITAISCIKSQKLPINTFFGVVIKIDYEQNNESGVKIYETQPPPSKK
jgi:hypothetical protein